jgi:uncharacterized cupredoxin-like copper-binding protein
VILTENKSVIHEELGSAAISHWKSIILRGFQSKTMRGMMIIILRVLLILLVAMLSSACQKTTPAVEPVRFQVEMTEYTFNPNTIEIKAGQPVIIELKNGGLLAHEIMFGKEVVKNHNRPDGYRYDLFDNANTKPEVINGEAGGQAAVQHGVHGGHDGFMVTLPANNDTVLISFTPNTDMVGEWELGCFEQDGVHYDAGMKGRLVIHP